MDISKGSTAGILKCRHIERDAKNEYSSMTILMPVLEKVVDESFDQIEFYKLFRQRKTSTSYIHKLMMEAISKGHYSLALQIVMRMIYQLNSGLFVGYYSNIAKAYAK